MNMIPPEQKPLLVVDGFGYTDFDILGDGLLKINDIKSGINVINPHGKDPCVYASGDWEIVHEWSSDGKWVPWGSETVDSFPQQRTYIKLSDDPAETYIDAETKEVYSANRGADLNVFIYAAAACLALATLIKLFA